MAARQPLLSSWLLSRLLIALPLLIAALKPGARPLPQLLLSWDIVHYLTIAREGASGSNLAFFPLFPWLIQLAGRGETQLLWSGILLSNLAFLGALVALRWQARALWGEAAGRWTVLMACFNPLSLFCSIPYTEGIYLLTTALALALVEGPPASGRRSLLAGLSGAAAAASRPTGFLLAPALLIAHWRQRRLGWGLLNAALVGLGFGAVLLICWRATGDPLAFAAAQRSWGSSPGFNLSGLPQWGRLGSQILFGRSQPFGPDGFNPLHPLLMAGLLLAGLAVRVHRQRHPRLSLWGGAFTVLLAWLLGGAAVLNGAIIAGSGALLVWGRRRLPPGLWWFALLSVASFLLKQSTTSLERYLYATVPLLLLFGLWSSLHPRVGRMLIAFGSVLLVIFTLRLSNGEWVG